MNWDYIVGLFDGEGSLSLMYNPNLKPQIRISSSSKTHRKAIQEFLQKEGIVSCNFASEVKMGTSGGITVLRWEDCEKFLSHIIDKVVEKKEKALVFKDILTLHRSLRERNERLVDHLAEFDALRRRLHETSKKGRKGLIVWK